MNRELIRPRLLLISCALILSAAAGTAHAQGLPIKVMRCVVPYPAGGGTDTIARFVTTKLSETLGQKVIVENRAGADGRIGTELVAKAVPDGSTMAFVTNFHSISVSIFRSLPYDPIKDFRAISLAASSPNVLLVHPSVARTVSELVTLAKANPGKLNYSTSGLAQSPHLNGELFKTMAGIDIVQVPYKGTPEAFTALLQGLISMSFGSISNSLSQVKAGKLRALAITSAKRSEVLPDVPTMVESGFPGFVTATWYGFLAPAQTPRPVISRLNAEIVKILNSVDTQDRFAKIGFDPSPSTAEEFDEYIKTEVTRWGKVVRDAGIPLQD